MPGTTTEGLPYPLGSEPFADGADAIQALAEAVPSYARSHILAFQVLGQNLASGSNALVVINDVEEQSSDWSLNVGTGLMTYTGPDAVFMVVGSVDFEDNAAGYRELAIDAVGSATRHVSRVPAMSGVRSAVQVSGLVPMGPSYDTTLGIRARQSSGVTLGLNGGDLGRLQAVELMRL